MANPQSIKLPRDNLYITKPLLRLNKDFEQQPLIRNVQ